ncbi:DUF4145 domain-containing protein [Clostridiaceae bacterium HSG29]|nr:DUF4145 domain-containing protein [Clostridiaceae bacterium HSG29]
MKIIKLEEKDKLAGKVIRSFCVKCNNYTNHKIVSNYRIDDSEKIENGRYEISWYDDYQMILCLGCDTMSFKHDSSFSEDWDPETGGVNTIIYPKRKQKIPLELNHLTPEIDRLYREVIDTYNIGAYTLSAIGIRGLIEGICLAKNIKSGNVPVKEKGKNNVKKSNLEGKIYGLLQAGLISAMHVEILNELRWLGNSAVHEIEKPRIEQVDVALKIVESLLELIFGLEKKGQILKRFRKR